MSILETVRTGKIANFYDADSGSVIENQTGKDFDFVKMGAMVDFAVNDEVIFVTITTPQGKIIVKNVIKK